MIYKPIPIIIRSILTLALIYGVYTETGVWTTISLLLISVGIEVGGYFRHLQDKHIKNMFDTLDTLVRILERERNR